jgi:lipoprotein-anchoring transpeptidase ErfK/SrfK
MKKIGIGVGVLVVVAALAMLGMKVMKKPVKAVKAAVPVAEKVAPAAPQPGFNIAFKEAQALEAKGELLAAQDIYKDLVMSFASRQDIEGIQKRLEDLNLRIILSAINVAGSTTIRKVKEGDSLSMIADEYRTTAELIKRENGLTSDVIRVGQPLRVWTGRFSILVDKSQNILTLKSDGEVVKTFRVSTGKDNITPVGTFKIVNKLRNPSWTHDGKLIPAGNPENILGTRWLGFDIPSYGIHGTTQPESIGQQATAGCVRMLNNEVEMLYDLLPTNTEATVID